MLLIMSKGITKKSNGQIVMTACDGRYEKLRIIKVEQNEIAR